jgi:hypothetical protein
MLQSAWVKGNLFSLIPASSWHISVGSRMRLAYIPLQPQVARQGE